MVVKKEIGTKIRIMRKSRGMTQADLAKAIDQSASSITMYETGRREPDFTTLEALADVFNVSLFEFIPVAETNKDYIDEFTYEKPRTPEARVLAKGVDRLPPEERQQLLEMARLMFKKYEGYFEEKEKNDETEL